MIQRDVYRILVWVERYVTLAPHTPSTRIIKWSSLQLKFIVVNEFSYAVLVHRHTTLTKINKYINLT